MTKIDLLATGAKFLKHGLQGTGPMIEETIASATNEIHMMAYVITPHARHVLRLLEEALESGVKVTIVVNRLAEQDERTQARLRRMLKAYRHLRVVDFQLPRGELHAKVIVADRRRAVIGSANFSFGGMANNYEIGVRIDGKEAWKVSKLIDSLAD